MSAAPEAPRDRDSSSSGGPDGRRAGEGTLILAGTPIGNLGDASDRLRRALATAEVIAAEDTRRTRRLAAGLGVELTGRLVAHHEHNEQATTEQLLGELRSGATVLVVSDAGMPTVSDPGYRIAAAAAAQGLAVTSLPGPSAVLTALAVSGLPSDRFAFEGFLPRRTGQRAARLAELAVERRTMIFYEAPHRIVAMIEALTEAFGPDRPAAIARELTKLHEEVLRGRLGELHERIAEDGLRGEIVVVVQGAPEPAPEQAADLVGLVEAQVADGTRLKDAVGRIATDHGVSRRELYEEVLAARAREETAQAEDDEDAWD